MTIRFWKPYGVLTQFRDPEGRPNLGDFIDLSQVYAAGRLDFDSEGLLILTDDGALQARLTQPKYRHPKTYLAQVEKQITEEAMSQLRKGIMLKDGRTLPALVEQVDDPQLPERSVPIRYRANIPTSWVKLTIHEGRNRQVRRMTAAVGFPTLRLVRWSSGPITLEGLEPGAWQPLSVPEVKKLITSTSLAKS